ncbi:hypothetical protein [Roseibaca sp. Y0-43]|uniref:hypothetical protein n=1 Tax=Roseibaca sp. Y0-43 TaxID=2816854 RepID=UPI001D0C6850|nr:hypothetical protein [Roseibaca sp. Y0-43]MCC1482225.1 hypothetical protein [Roseibaca sp. Y0-43]
MASVTTDILVSGATESLMDKLTRVLESMAQLSPTYRRVEQLSATSDAELRAQGLTRQDAVEQIFGGRFYA